MRGQSGRERTGRRTPAEQALAAALSRYRSGAADLRQAAHEAGVPEWELLSAVHATPDPVGAELDKGLRPFVRDRDEH